MRSKNNKKAFFIVPLEVFEYDIIVSCGQTNDEVLTSLSNIKKGKKDLIERFKYNVENPPSDADGYCVVLNNGCTLLRMIEHPKNSKDYGILMHEVFHAVSQPLRDKGVKLSNSSEETFAYAIGYVSTQIFKKLW